MDDLHFYMLLLALLAVTGNAVIAALIFDRKGIMRTSYVLMGITCKVMMIMSASCLVVVVTGFVLYDWQGYLITVLLPVVLVDVILVPFYFSAEARSFIVRILAPYEAAYSSGCEFLTRTFK